MNRPLTGESLAAFLRRTQERVAVSRELLQRSRSRMHASGEAMSRSRVLLSRVEIGLFRASEQPEQASAAANAPVTQRPKASTTAPPELFELVSGRTFRNEVVSLDGRHFVECTIENCVLRYSGQPMVLETTTFDGCTFEFGSEAAQTVQFLECFSMMAESATDYTLRRPDQPRSGKPN